MRPDRSRLVNYQVIAVIWAFIWLFFFIRGLALTDYKVFKNIAVKDVEEKRRHMMKKGLYDFIGFCREAIPEKDDFAFVYDRTTLDPVETSRTAYYLYPRKMREGALYIMVFGVSGYGKRGFELMERFDETSFILRKAD